MDERLQHFSKKLRELRLSKDYLQKNIANDLGISPNYYSEVERGEKIPSLDLVFKISDYYEVSLSQLFPQEVSQNFHIHDNEVGNGIVNNNFDKELVVDLYEKLLKSKDEMIEILKGNSN